LFNFYILKSKKRKRKKKGFLVSNLVFKSNNKKT